MSVRDLTSDEGGEEGARPAYRSLVALAALAAGYMLARRAPGVEVLLWLAGAQGAVAVAAAARGLLCKGALIAAVVLLGAGWFGARCHEAPASMRSLLSAAQENAVVEIEGMVTSSVREAETPGEGPAFLREPAARFEVAVQKLWRGSECEHARARVLVRVAGDADVLDAEPGSTVRVMGVLRAVAEPSNPGEPDRRLWAHQDGRIGTLLVSSSELVRRVEPDSRGLLRRAGESLVRVRERVRAGLERALGTKAGAPAAGVVQALLLGTYEPGVREVADAMSRTGLIHLLAISGFHLIVLARMGSMVFRVLGDPFGLEPWVMGALVVVYVGALPAEAPVLRAALMVLALLIADNCGRRYVRLSVLGWVAVALLLWRPMDLWSLGLQLSFGIVGTLLWAGRSWQARFVVPESERIVPRAPVRTWWSGAGRWLWDEGRRAAATGVLCWLAASAIVLHHTGVLSPLAVPATLLLTPLLGAMLVVGYPVLLLSMVWPRAGEAVSFLVLEPAGWVAGCAEWLDGVGMSSIQLPAVSAAFATAMFAAVALGAKRLSWRTLGKLGAALGVWLAAEVWAGPLLSWRGVARLDALSVGDGSCLLLRVRDGTLGQQSLLWDCGSLRPGVSPRVVSRSLRELGAARVRTAVVTHADVDHFSALAAVAPAIGVRRVIVTEQLLIAAEKSTGVARLVHDLRRAGIDVVNMSPGERIAIGEGTLELLWPERGYEGAIDNDASMMARLEVPVTGGAHRAILLTGDATPAAIGRVLGQHSSLKAEIVEAPHHGSFNPTAAGLVRASGAQVVLQSSGARRGTDPRWLEAVGGGTWLSTAERGACAAWIDRSGTVRWSAWRKATLSAGSRDGP